MSTYPTGKRKKIGTPKIASKSKSDKDPSSYVLRMLLNASPYYVSGSVLAQKLKMSRVGVWSRIDKLRKAGLTIEASQNLGYRLAGEPNALNLPLLNAWMKDNKKFCDIFTHDEVDSKKGAEDLVVYGIAQREETYISHLVSDPIFKQYT